MYSANLLREEVRMGGLVHDEYNSNILNLVDDK